ncbi:MAG: NUDIX hydrolase [Desulfobacca sp.]|nr:NUDIX hydrolase [Desulfobacca sp.]
MKERSYPDHPWLGVGGIVFQGDRVLLVKRGKEPGLGQWSIPGGIVEVGEPLTRAVQREMEEETGFQVEVRSLVEVFERILPDEQGRILYHYVILDYLCSIKSGRLMAGSDVTEAVFSPLAELGALGVSSETKRVIEKAYSTAKVFS